MVGTRETELLSSASAASTQMRTATDELRQERHTTSTQGRVIAKIKQLKMIIKSLEDDVSFTEGSGEDVNSELAATITESTWLCQLFDSVRAEGAEIQERLGGRDTVIPSIIKYSCVTLAPSLMNSVKTFRALLNKSVSQTVRTGSIGSQLYAVAAIDCVTIRFSQGTSSEDGGGSTRGEDVTAPTVETDVIEL